MEKFVPDSIVQATIDRFLKRAEFGYKKYGTNLDRTDLSPEQWAQHALEEMHDGMLYIQKWQQEQYQTKRLLELLLKVYDVGVLELSDEEAMEFFHLKKWHKEHTK